MMDEKRLMRAIGVVGELQTNLLARYWNANEVFEGVSYTKAKEVYFKEMKALERLDRAIRYALEDDKQLTWEEYNNLVFHNNPCLLIKDIELCLCFTRLCEVGVTERIHFPATKDQNGASRSVSSQSEASYQVPEGQSEASCGVSEVVGENLGGATDLQVLEWALEMLREIEERRVAKLQSRDAELLTEPVRCRC